jgi:hypothetical protein
VPKITFVNNEPLDPAALEQEFQAIKAHYESLGSMSCCDRDDEFQGYALDHVMARVLLHQEADRLQLAVTDEDLDGGLNALYAQHGGKEQFYLNTSMSPSHEPEVRQDLVHSMRVEKTLRSLIGEVPSPTEDQVRAFYEAHQQDYLTQEEASALHLYKKVDRTEDRLAVYDEIRRLRELIRAGEDFATVAAAHTDKEDKLVDLGWFKPNDFNDEFGVIIFSLEVGELSPVFASYFGFHLALCTGRKRPEVKPYSEVQEDVRSRVIAEDQQARSQAAVETLKAQAVIETRQVSHEEKAALGL